LGKPTEAVLSVADAGPPDFSLPPSSLFIGKKDEEVEERSFLFAMAFLFHEEKVMISSLRRFFFSHAAVFVHFYSI